jgi:hypothetical protein
MQTNQDNTAAANDENRRPTLADAAAESDNSLRTAAKWILEGRIELAESYVRTPEEAAAELESLTGQQLDHGTTAAAIATLKERQRRLRRQKRKLLDLMETADEGLYANMGDTLTQLNRQIQDTKIRLEQYNLQRVALAGNRGIFVTHRDATKRGRGTGSRRGAARGMPSEPAHFLSAGQGNPAFFVTDDRRSLSPVSRPSSGQELNRRFRRASRSRDDEGYKLY